MFALTPNGSERGRTRSTESSAARHVDLLETQILRRPSVIASFVNRNHTHHNTACLCATIRKEELCVPRNEVLRHWSLSVFPSFTINMQFVHIKSPATFP